MLWALGPHKIKAQWKKTFIDWKSSTKKKARECVRSEQRTGGREPDGKKLTPIEEKLLAILSWITVKGAANVLEVGLEADSQVEEVQDKYELEVIEPISEEIFIEGKKSDMDGVPDDYESKAGTSKRPAESTHYIESNKRRKIGTNNLQKAAESYAAGQKETLNILKHLKHLRETGGDKFHEKELELKEAGLKKFFFLVKNESSRKWICGNEK